jgi:hypothetical protein
MFMVKFFQKNTPFSEILIVNECLGGQGLFILTIQNFQRIFSLGIANNHGENSFLALILVLADLHKFKNYRISDGIVDGVQMGIKRRGRVVEYH